MAPINNKTRWMDPINTATWCAAVLIVTGVFTAAGCSGPDASQQGHMEMSPGFETIALSHEQNAVRHARTLDTNSRQLVDDIDRILLIDRPMRMSIYPIP